MGNSSELEGFRRALEQKHLEKAWGKFRLLQAGGRDGLLEAGELAAFAGMLEEVGSALEAARIYLQAADRAPEDTSAPAWLFRAARLLLGPAQRPEWGEKIRQRLIQSYPQSEPAAQAAALQPGGTERPAAAPARSPASISAPLAGPAARGAEPLRPLLPRWAWPALAVLAALWIFSRMFSERLAGAGEIDQRLFAEPLQTELAQAEPVPMEAGDFWLTLYPRFDYRICGLVVSVNDYQKFGLRFQDFYHRDFCLIWGDNVSSGLFRHSGVEFEHHGNVCYYQCRSALCPSGRLLSNTHLLSADREVLKAIDRVRRSDQVCLRGKLVDVSAKPKQAPAGQAPAAARLATSTTREDQGLGACEIMLVEEVEILVEGNRLWRVLSSVGCYGFFLLMLVFLAAATTSFAHRIR
jgi:hypothetical protein